MKVIYLSSTFPGEISEADAGFLERGFICIKVYVCVCVGGGGVAFLILSNFS